MKCKSIKDAIHGYITLEEPFWKIVDTAEFQRLKWIEQTSYRVLYPSARHDRFIHSIGVYHLGQRAIRGFLKNCTEENKDLVTKHQSAFLLACILHDIGHAPFSHTCEDLYNYQQKMCDMNSPINAELCAEMKRNLSKEAYDNFEKDYKYILSPKGKSPSEHEVMSAIITCRKFDEFRAFFDEPAQSCIELDLIVRAIIGCCYGVNREDEESLNREKGIKNCLIRLLNSSTVDVDKLDYIARDTQMSGYDNIVLDTERLLESVCIVRKDNVFYPSYKKSAMSVINNVVAAKNSQAKWIVNHPVVIYEAYALRRAIGESLKDIKIFVDDKELSYDQRVKFLFSSKSLSVSGNRHKNGTFSLLSDIEILNMMKTSINNPRVLEYFARDHRKKPVWKSHEEYLFSLNSSIDDAKIVATYMAPLINYLNHIEDMSHTKQIDEMLYQEISANTQIEGREELLQILDVLKNYKQQDGSEVAFDYVVLPAKNRFFTQMDSKHLYIRFGENDQDYTCYATFEDQRTEVINRGYEFFYLYAKSRINPQHFLRYLQEEAKKINTIRM